MITVDLAEIIAAAFMAGVKQQAKAEGKKAGKKSVKYVVDDLPGDVVEGFRIQHERRKKVARTASAYSKRYGIAFKKLAKKYKKKDGGWKKDGFKRCAAAARKQAKK